MKHPVGSRTVFERRSLAGADKALLPTFFALMILVGS